jgi:hypothetical protein
MLPCDATCDENILRSVAQTAAFWRSAAFCLEIPNYRRPAKGDRAALQRPHLHTSLIIDNSA